MAVAFDAKGTVFDGAATTSFTNTSLTIGAISNGVLVVFITFEAAVSSLLVKWDSTGTFQTMTQIGTKASSDNLSFAYLFGLIAPHTGNKTLSVSWTGSAAYGGIAASFSGADQAAFATTFKNVVTDASTPTVDGNYPYPSGMAITTISGDMAIMVAGTNAGGFSAGQGLGTEIGIDTTNADMDSRYLAASGTSTAVAATENFHGNPFCAVGCAIAQVAAAGNPQRRTLLGVG